MADDMIPTTEADQITPLPPRAAMVEALREMVQLGSDNPKMPEAIFKDFLRVLYDPVADKFDVELWYRTFNSHRLPVDILDPAGSVIMVCPPIMGTVETMTGVARADSLSTLVESTQQLGRRHAGLAEKTFQEGLAHYKEGSNRVVQHAWYTILAHYGIITAPASATPQAHAAEELWQGDMDEV